MTKWLQAARQSTEGQTQSAYSTGADAGNAPQERVLSVLSVLSQGEHTPARPAEIVATPQQPKPEPAKGQTPEAFPYGFACNLGDAPRTWTGGIVSLADWRTLTDWDRHGPNGRDWCGLCQGWHWPGDCEDGGGESKTACPLQEPVCDTVIYPAPPPLKKSGDLWHDTKSARPSGT